MSCALCHIRKERRFCPAVHGQICPQCCGEQREVTLDCPSDCPYLRQAREHEKPSQSGVSSEGLFLDVEVSDQFLYQHEHLLAGLSFALSRAARGDRTLNDRDLVSALQAMAASQQTLVRSGLHYAEPAVAPAQTAVIAAVDAMFREYEELERKELGQSRLTSTDKLKALVFLVRMSLARTSGRPKSRALIDFLSEHFPQPASGASPSQSSLIVP